MQKNRRNFSRIKFDSMVYIRNKDQRIEARLIDISLKGALVSVNANIVIAEKDKCIFEFHLNESEIILNVPSLLVYLKDDNLGLKFENIELESMVHLRRLVELNIGDPDIIQQELFFLVSPQE
ncbi:PilZ domain-containing protein [bacterium]|nr:PilZ domain-containing protein [bacterium]